MSHTLSIEQASARLDQLVSDLGPGDEIVLTKDDKPVARIVPDSSSLRPREAGTCKGMIDILDDSDDIILEHFKDYMP
jgi:antitoxin (DNA-binding transcriptional repressor) of toxin-antitoxin stability system